MRLFDRSWPAGASCAVVFIGPPTLPETDDIREKIVPFAQECREIVSRAMPLERHTDDLTARDGVKFWMSDGERPVLCRVSHEALRDLATSDGPDEKVFEAYRELIEQVASDAYDAGTSVDDAGLVLVTSGGACPSGLQCIVKENQTRGRPS